MVDFRWHRTTQSPNWYVIPEDQREVIFLKNDGGENNLNSTATTATNGYSVNQAVLSVPVNSSSAYTVDGSVAVGDYREKIEQVMLEGEEEDEL